MMQMAFSLIGFCTTEFVAGISAKFLLFWKFPTNLAQQG
jgi:hypothetical protein